MAKNSTQINFTNNGHEYDTMPIAPRQSTLAFIRAFARSCASLSDIPGAPCVSLN